MGRSVILCEPVRSSDAEGVAAKRAVRKRMAVPAAPMSMVPRGWLRRASCMA